VRRLVSESADGIKVYTSQWWRCRHCRSRWFGELTEYISDGSYEHALYAADLPVWKEDLRKVKACRTPEDPSCTCPAHSGDLFEHYRDRISYSFEK
ncbi:MAG: hypothetical protein JXR21_03780, partial [Candidatus Marinimicrobia bacterium]|nr:hypothetical protein [Candidatus Neomarinimicrobiota bacterium]